jgi:hypothetical protein
MSDVSIEELEELLESNSDPDGQWRGADVCDALTRLIDEKQQEAEWGSPIRQEVLEEAIGLTCGDRNQDYGDPRPNFEDTAAMWSAYKGVTFEAHDVAAMMILLKVARLKTSPGKRDNWTDAAGYAGLGAEVSAE